MPTFANDSKCPNCRRSLAIWSSRLFTCPFCSISLREEGQVASAGHPPPMNARPAGAWRCPWRLTSGCAR